MNRRFRMGGIGAVNPARPATVLAWLLFATAPLAATASGAMLAPDQPDPATATANLSAAEAAAPDFSDRHVDFNASMLAGQSRQLDLSRFENPKLIAPGIYNLDVFLNQTWVGRLNVRFASPSPAVNAVACMTRDLVKRMPLPAIAPSRLAALDNATQCTTLDRLVNGATTEIDLGKLRLNATIPQLYAQPAPRGYVDPASWNPGINAFRLNYDLSVFRSDNERVRQTSSFLNLNAGLNLGLWHFRQHSIATHGSGNSAPSTTRWRNMEAYVSRDLPQWRSRLTLGDSFTDGAVLDSINLRGIRLSSVDRMEPVSRRGYAPVIQGVAQSNAKVEVVRGGQVIYQTTVPPGPFRIEDLYPSGSGGDLHVNITEADGTQRSFLVPFTAVGQLVRPGVLRYDLAAGRLRQVLDSDHRQTVVRGTLQYGLNNLFTGYAGFQGTQGYAAAIIGGAFNTAWGALALDLTQAGISLPGYTAHTGQSLRATWSQTLPSLGTRINVAAYRYSTRGFLSLTDAVAARSAARNGLNTFQPIPNWATGQAGPGVPQPTSPQQLAWQQQNPLFAGTRLLHRRNRFTIALSQPLGDGSLYLNASFSDYWNRPGNNHQYQVGYNNHIGPVSWSIAASRAYNPFARAFEDRAFLTINVPLGRAAYAPNLMFNASHDNHGRNQQQVTVAGVAGADHAISWGASVQHRDSDRTTGGSLHAGYRGAHAIYRAATSFGSGYQQQSAGISGGVLVTADGAALTQPLGPTVGLVQAPGATGARIPGTIGVQVDTSGHAVIPNLRPYQRNTVRLDPRGIPLGVELVTDSINVAPYAGSVVKLTFQTRSGRPLIAHIVLADGSPAPFGATVKSLTGEALGIVGQGGTALLRGVQDHGTLAVEWTNASNGSPHTCRFAYQAPAASAARLPMTTATCRASTSATVAPVSAP